MITGVRSDCGPAFSGPNDRLTMGQLAETILQQNRYQNTQFHIFHPCANDNQHFDSWGG